MFKIILLVFLIVGISQQKGTTMAQLESMLIQFNTSPFVNLLFIYDSAKEQAALLEQAIEQIGRKRKGYFDVKLLDCNTEDPMVAQSFIYCQDPYREQLPALMFSEPSLNPHEASPTPGSAPMKQYQGALDDKSLFNFAVPLMKIYSIELRTMKDFNKFQNSLPGTPKIIYFTDKQKIPPLYRALTANFRKTIAFAHVFSKSKLASELQISSYPVFMLNGKQKIQVKANLQQMINRFQIIQGQQTQIEVSQYKSNPTVEITEQNIEQKVYKLPQHTLVHVPGADGSEHPEWENIIKKWGKMFVTYDAPGMKDALNIKQTPSIVFFPKSIAKKKVMKTVFTTKNTMQNIHDEIYSMLDDFTVTLADGMEMQKHTGIHLQDEKFVAVLFHEDQIPMPYKIISNDDIFEEDLTFFRMRNPEPQIMEQFSIKKLPSVIVMMLDKQAPQEAPSQKQLQQGRMNMNLKLAAYTGKFVYDDLYSYFSTFSRKAQEQLRRSKTSSKDEYEAQTFDTKILRKITKASKFDKICKQQNCYLLLLNGKEENKQKNLEYVLSLDSQAFKMSQHNFGYIDAVCHSEILATLEIMEDQLPALIYVNSKFEKYARMVGRLESRSINSFFAKVKANRSPYRGYEKLVITDKDCIEQHNRLKKMSEQSAQISQQEASILEQLREQQEKKRQQFQKAQKDEKVRKKNRKKRPKKQWEEDL